MDLLKHIGGPILGGVTTMAFTIIMFVLVDGYGLTSSIPLLFGSAMLFGVVATCVMSGGRGIGGSGGRKGQRVLFRVTSP